MIPDQADLVEATVDIVRRMQETVLCIQGPPGCGKTFTAAQAILGLLRNGKAVGVTANSHKTILNVLRTVHDAMKQAGEDFRLVKLGESAADCKDPLDAGPHGGQSFAVAIGW